jgi:hypothetical protein
MVKTKEEKAVVSSKPEILPFILAEIKLFFKNGIVFNELSICHVLKWLNK